jgi:hypothetical protein
MPIYFDTTDAQETLTRMQIQIRDMGHEIIPEQLTTWQREDMHRKYPNTELPNYVSAETYIWPRSRTYEGAHKKRETRIRQFKKPLSAMPRFKGTPGAHHPILRPSLFKALCERMEQVLSVNLNWVTTRTDVSNAPKWGPDPTVKKRLSRLGPSNYNP